MAFNQETNYLSAHPQVFAHSFFRQEVPIYFFFFITFALQSILFVVLHAI